VEITIMATRKPSFTPEQLQEYIDQALARQRAEFEASLKAAQTAKPAKGKALDISKTDAAITKAFAAKGYADIVLLDRSKPVAGQLSTVTCLTYKLWMTQCGRKVRDGEKAIAVRGIPYKLFHKLQTEVATTAERKAYHAKMQKAAERRQARAEQPAA
jgi:hypothetical protein